MGLCQCEIQKGCVRDVCNDWHMDGIQQITLNKKFSGISYWCGVMYEIPIKQHEDNCGSFPLPLYFLADLCTGIWKDCISVPPGRQGTGEVGNGARLICPSGVSGALAHLLSYSCICVLNCPRKGLYDWLCISLHWLPSWACSLAAFKDFCLDHGCRCPEPWVLYKLLLFRGFESSMQVIHWKRLFSDSAKCKREVEKTEKNEKCQQV